MLKVSPNGKVLIVGPKPSRFDPNWRDHPRIVFWDGDDGRTLRQRQLPKNIDVVYFTKHLSHTLQEKVRSLANDGTVIVYRKVRSSGEIKRLLRESGILNPKEVILPTKKEEKVTVQPTKAAARTETPQPPQPPTPPPTPPADTQKPARLKRGTVQAFVKKHGNLSVPNVNQELLRLLGVAKDSGLTTATFNSIRSAFYRWKKAKQVPSTENHGTAAASAKQPQHPDSLKAIQQFLSSKAIHQFLSSMETVAVAFEEVLEENVLLRNRVSELEKKLAQVRELTSSV